MSIDRELLKMMPHTVTIEPFANQDEYSKASYGAPATFRCYVDFRPKMIRKIEGQEIVSSAQVYVGGVSGATVKARITLPDGSQPVILMVNKLSDEGGDYAEVIYV
ncbi:MAG: hypothetical protein WBV94_25220 [Blastocatellia bacterium]